MVVSPFYPLKVRLLAGYPRTAQDYKNQVHAQPKGVDMRRPAMPSRSSSARGTRECRHTWAQS